MSWSSTILAMTGAVVRSWILAIAALAGVLIAAAAFAVSFRQIRLTAKQMRRSAKQVASESEERTRPYVGVEFVPSIVGAPAFDIVMTSHGRTTAQHVRLRLVEDQFGPQSDNDQIGPALGRLMDKGFDLAPGARLRLIWRIEDRPGAFPRGDMGAPDAGEVLVTYEWRRDDRTLKEYQDKVSYDLGMLNPLLMAPSTGPTSSGTDAHERNLLHVLRSIAAHVAELRR